MASRSKSQFSIVVTFIALSILGLAMIPLLPVKLLPSRTLPALTVSFAMPGAPSRVVESEVTSRLEGLLARIDGVREINSISDNGSGSISLGFDRHTDMEQARFEASAIIRQSWAGLPDGVSYPTVSSRRSSSKASRPVLSYTINGQGTPAEIMKYAETTLRPALGSITGVHSVQLSGATPMEWHLTYDMHQLSAMRLKPADLIQAIAGETSMTYLGTASDINGRWLSVTMDAGTDTLDVSRILVMTGDSTPVSLDRLVTVERRVSPPTSYSRLNGLTSIYCNIYADADVNQLELSEKIRRKLGEMQLPQGYAMHLNYDSTEDISRELNKIYFRSGLTLLILLAFVVLITLNVRYMLIISISLLLSLAVSVIFYVALDVEIQIYSLAGITISLNLMIDNVIVMADHLRRKGDRRVVTAILAATLTTIGALSTVLFLDDDLRLDLADFVTVVMVNLSVSVVAALWLVPALMGLMKLRAPRRRRLHVKWPSFIGRLYSRFIAFGRRHRWIFVTAGVLAFGLPVFMLPTEVPGCDLYNDTLGSKRYTYKIRPVLDKVLGGTLRLFVEKVYDGSSFKREISDPELYIAATLPNGATLEQMDQLIRKMEIYLSGFEEIRQFRTDVYSPYNATIVVQFVKEAALSGFPYQLQSEVIGKALSIGGGSWSVYGLENQGFDNSVEQFAGNYRIKVTGYNYDRLESIAMQMRKELLANSRIKSVTVSSDYVTHVSDYTEYRIEVDRAALARQHLSAHDLYDALGPTFGRDIFCATAPDGSGNIVISSAQNREYDVWALVNMPFGGFKVKDFATIERTQAPKSVAKENQQYRLCLQFEYVGSYKEANKMVERFVDKYSRVLPMGYTVENGNNWIGWKADQLKNYWLIGLVIVIIFFITAILFNSLRLPVVVIAMIPLSFTGVFLMFYFTRVRFDQGGFASFILLSGITVNAAIYLIYEMMLQRKAAAANGEGYSGITALFVSALKVKSTTIILTVLSTVLGFVPFMVGQELFWYPLALGTIGGLMASLVALVVFLPVFLPRNKSGVRQPHGQRTP